MFDDIDARETDPRKDELAYAMAAAACLEELRAFASENQPPQGIVAGARLDVVRHFRKRGVHFVGDVPLLPPTPLEGFDLLATHRKAVLETFAVLDSVEEASKYLWTISDLWAVRALQVRTGEEVCGEEPAQDPVA